MFRINRCYYLLFGFLLVFAGFFNSCQDKTELHFHYSDGTVIKDSTVIPFLIQQLHAQVPEYDSTVSANVTTCLNKKIARKMGAYFRSDSSVKASGIVILENKTGNMVYCKNSDELHIYSQQFQTMKMYGILLSLEKGVKLTDTFSWTGKYSKKRYDSTVARLYRMSAPSLEYKYPFDDYSCGQWSAFLQKLDVSENERDCADGEIFPRYYFRTSLFDLTKTGVLINQNGALRSNNLFEKVQNSGRKSIHEAKVMKGAILKTETCLDAKKILKRDPFDLIEFSYPIFLYKHSKIRNGMILSTKKYTIGFLADSKSDTKGFVTKEIYSLVSLLEHSKH